MMKRIDPSQVNNLYQKKGLTRERLRQPFEFDEKKGTGRWGDGFLGTLNKRMLKHVVDDELDGQRVMIPTVPLPQERRKEVASESNCQAVLDAILAGERSVIAGRDRATVCEKSGGVPIVELGFTPADATVYVTYDKTPSHERKPNGVPITKIRLPEPAPEATKPSANSPS